MEQEQKDDARIDILLAFAKWRGLTPSMTLVIGETALMKTTNGVYWSFHKPWTHLDRWQIDQRFTLTIREAEVFAQLGALGTLPAAPSPALLASEAEPVVEHKNWLRKVIESW